MEIFEAWTMPSRGGATPNPMTLKVGAIPIVRGTWTNPRNKVGQGKITIRADFADLDQIITVDPANHTNDRGSMIRIRLPGTPSGDEDYSFIAESLSEPYDEAGGAVVDVSGRGREALLDDAIVFPYDYPGPGADGSKTLQADHVWGGKNILRNPGFEESQEITSGTGDDRAPSGEFSPTHWDISRDPDTGEFHGNIDTPLGPPEETGFTTQDASDGVTPDEGTFLGKINPLDVDTDQGRFSGIQQIVRVKPGWTYTARIKAFSGATPTFGWRFVMRNLEEGIAAGAEPPGSGSYDEKDLTPLSTWIQYGPIEFVVPADVDTIIFRMGLTTGSGNPTPVRFDTGQLNEGIDKDTAGAIWQALFNDVTVDHVSEATAPNRDRTLQYLKFDGFSATLDKSGATWADELSVTVKGGKRMLQVADQFAKLGFEWDLVWNNGAASYEFELYEAGNQGVDLSTSAEVAVIDGASLTGGQTTKRRPGGTHVMAFGPGGNLAQETALSLDNAWGRREATVVARDALDLQEVTAEAATQLGHFQDATLALTATIDQTAQVLPVRDFGVGDLIQVVRGSINQVLRVERILSISRGDHGSYRVDFGSRGFTRTGSFSTLPSDWRTSPPELVEAVSRLMDEYKGLETDPSDLLGFAPDAAGAATASALATSTPATTVVAAVDSSAEAKARADFICDGVDDDLTITDALGVSAVFPAVYLLNGNYNLGNSLSTLAHGHIYLQGESREGVIVTLNSGGNVPMLNQQNTSHTIRVFDITFNADNKGRWYQGLSAPGIFKATRCNFFNSLGDGMASRASYIQLHDCTLAGAGDDAVQIEEANVEIINCDISGAGDDGIVIFRFTNLNGRIIGNHIHNNGGNGIELNNSVGSISSVVIAANTTRANGANGCAGGNSAGGNVIAGNNFEDGISGDSSQFGHNRVGGVMQTGTYPSASDAVDVADTAAQFATELAMMYGEGGP